MSQISIIVSQAFAGANHSFFIGNGPVETIIYDSSLEVWSQDLPKLVLFKTKDGKYYGASPTSSAIINLRQELGLEI